MEKLRAGIVGVGFIGAVHVEALRRLGNVEVVAVADSANAEARAKALFVPAAYSDYKEMLDKENLDCIHICTPNNTHYEIAAYAAAKGVNIVCEKPMAGNVEEAKKMVELAEKAGIVNAVNFNYRYYPIAGQMRDMVKNGKVGDIYSVYGSYLQDWLYYDTDYSWRLEPEMSGESRAFADIGSHWIDSVEYITGLKVTEVMADFAIFHKTRKKPLKPIETYSGMALRPEDYAEVPITTEDYASILFHFEGGAHGSCNISQVFAGRKNQMVLSVAGSQCAIEWDTEDSNELWVGHRERENGKYPKDPSILEQGAKDLISYPGGHVEGFPDTFKQNFKNVYAAISDKNAAANIATFKDGLREMVLCDRIVQSARERRWVTVD